MNYKKISMNVWKTGWLPMRHPANWLKNIKHIGYCIKWSLQRVVKGYCDNDIFDLDTYYLDMFYNTLSELANFTNSHPSDMTENEWREYLNNTAKYFYRANESNNFYYNKYEDSYFNYLTTHEINPQNIDADAKAKYIKDLWLDEEKDISYTREFDLNLGMQNLRARFFDLWD